MKTLVLALACSAGIAAAQSTPAPQPITVDCRYALQMQTDLEQIIARPTASNSVWDKTLSWVGGTGSPQQRLASAKTMLWTIRTQCRGY